MVLTILLFVIGFYILIKGANILVDGASAIARFLNISSFVIGLVIAGIGTSIPEFSIYLISHIAGTGEVGLGTIVGSNTFNILFVLGMTAIFFPLTLKKVWIDRDLKLNIIAIATTILFAYVIGFGEISRLEGLIMLVLFCWWLFMVSREDNTSAEDDEKSMEVTLPLATLLIMAGIIGVFLGGKWVVDGAAAIAEYMGMSRALIGLTVIGIGTSLPELAITFVAAYRKRPGLAVGNIIGSNIFDFLMILGISAIMKPIVMSGGFAIDISVTIFSATALYVAMYIGTPNTLKKWQGWIFVATYIAYFIFVVIRG